MRKRHGPLDPPEALAWLYGQADAAGVDLQRGSIAETAHCAVAHLERQVEAGFLPTPEALQLASLLVRLAGELVVAGATSAHPFIERACFRARARWLAEQYEVGVRSWTRPPIAEPELEPESEPEPLPVPDGMVSIHDLLLRLESTLQDLLRLHPRREADPGQ